VTHVAAEFIYACDRANNVVNVQPYILDTSSNATRVYNSLSAGAEPAPAPPVAPVAVARPSASRGPGSSAAAPVSNVKKIQVKGRAAVEEYATALPRRVRDQSAQR